MDKQELIKMLVNVRIIIADFHDAVCCFCGGKVENDKCVDCDKWIIFETTYLNAIERTLHGEHVFTRDFTK